MNIPKRIQRKRTKGYRQPPNTLYCGRPSKWGNPLKVSNGKIYIDAGHRRNPQYKWTYLCNGDVTDMIDIYKNMFKPIQERKIRPDILTSDFLYWCVRLRYYDITELSKYDYLSCFCPLDRPCHVDVLISELSKVNKQTCDPENG